ncbi:MAG: TetR/AcrR family transcriptional regulator [Ilumatobacteraceae bacterium]
MRHQATVDEIVAAAWELSRANGLGNFSMRELGERVGMRAQSVYSYFASKHEIYDAMFAEGNRALLECMQAPTDAAGADSDLVAAMAIGMRRYFRFCTSDPIRYQLLFQRTIPDFVPTGESFAIAQQAYDVALARLRALGVDQSGLDLFTAVMAGLVAQQISNEPEGDRWERQIERAVKMLTRELAPDLGYTKKSRKRT